MLVLVFDCKLLVIEVRVVEEVVDTLRTRKPKIKITQNKEIKNQTLLNCQ